METVSQRKECLFGSQKTAVGKKEGEGLGEGRTTTCGRSTGLLGRSGSLPLQSSCVPFGKRPQISLFCERRDLSSGVLMRRASSGQIERNRSIVGREKRLLACIVNRDARSASAHQKSEILGRRIMLKG